MNKPIDIPHLQPVAYETDVAYLSADKAEINNRVTVLATTEQYQEQFREGIKLYQSYTMAKVGESDDEKRGIIKTVEGHNFRLVENITRPDLSESNQETIEDKMEAMRQQEDVAAKVVAGQLGFVCQALAKNDIPAVAMGIHHQREILDSPPMVDSIVSAIVPILETNISNLPELKSSLEMFELWDNEAINSYSPSQELIDSLAKLAQYAYLEKGISLSRSSQGDKPPSSYELIDQIASTLIRGTENIGHLDVGDLKRHMSQIVSNLGDQITGSELFAGDPLAGDHLLAGKLLNSIIETPEVFDHLHPRVQEELRVTLKGFLLEAKVEPSKLNIIPIKETKTAEPVTTLPVAETILVKETPTPVLFDENTIFTLINLKNVAELIQVADSTHEYIKGEAVTALAKATYKQFSQIWKTITINKGNLFKKDSISIGEKDNIDEQRRKIEESSEYKNKVPLAVAKLIALNLVKKEIDRFNGIE